MSRASRGERSHPIPKYLSLSLVFLLGIRLQNLLFLLGDFEPYPSRVFYFARDLHNSGSLYALLDTTVWHIKCRTALTPHKSAAFFGDFDRGHPLYCRLLVTQRETLKISANKRGRSLGEVRGAVFLSTFHYPHVLQPSHQSLWRSFDLFAAVQAKCITTNCQTDRYISETTLSKIALGIQF